MPLTPADDYLIHQTPETMDRVFTSDRNFYDRYFYGVYPIDGSMHMLFAFGQYPNVGVMDAFATIVVDDKTQYIVRASRALGSDRMDTQGGADRGGGEDAAADVAHLVRGQRRRGVVRPDVRGADVPVRGAALPADVGAEAGDGLHADDAARSHVGDADGGRDDAHDHAGRVVGGARPLVGDPAARRRAAGGAAAEMRHWAGSTGSGHRCSSTTSAYVHLQRGRRRLALALGGGAAVPVRRRAGSRRR